MIDIPSDFFPALSEIDHPDPGITHLQKCANACPLKRSQMRGKRLSYEM
jgi:hypothetical protein